MSDSKTLIIRQYLSRCFFSVDTTKMIHRMKYIYFKRNFTLILIRRVSILFLYISRDCNALTFGTVICFENVTIFKILCIINYVYMIWTEWLYKKINCPLFLNFIIRYFIVTTKITLLHLVNLIGNALFRGILRKP